MFTAIHPKLPMRDKAATRNFYTDVLGFRDIGAIDYPDYLLLQCDEVQLHFFSFPDLDPSQNYGQVYVRIDNIDEWYAAIVVKGLHVPAPENKAWGQREFSILDPDNNLLTFGQSI